MYASSATAPGWAVDPEPATLWTTSPGPDRFTTRRQISGGPTGPSHRGPPHHEPLVSATCAADVLTRTPPGTTVTALTLRCSGSPVTGMTKRNWPEIRLDRALLPEATEIRLGVTAIPEAVADSDVSAETGMVTPR